ncbi:hypothetical protein MRX96_002134 [Rhipicephalus microplus]
MLNRLPTLQMVVCFAATGMSLSSRPNLEHPIPMRPGTSPGKLAGPLMLRIPLLRQNQPNEPHSAGNQFYR